MYFSNPSSIPCLGACFIVLWSKIRYILMPVMSPSLRYRMFKLSLSYILVVVGCGDTSNPFCSLEHLLRRGKYDEHAVSYGNALRHRTLACI